YGEAGRRMVRFGVHPYQDRDEAVIAVAPVKDQRWVSDSGGHREFRFVIETPLTLGSETWAVELTLTNRDPMKFRLLLGRTALRGRFVVAPDRS
ncbi:MAG: ATP-dependent zinc protease, partial [Gemmatimonadetes bacterium]|nr:ATP-dependent zinc protease [Gemmatimonadota bacterium]